MANKLQVRICGQEYTLVSDESREYMLETADYVDRKMIEVKNMNGRLSTSMAAILVALNITDDLQKEKIKNKETIDAQNAEIEMLKRKLDEAVKRINEYQSRVQRPQPTGYNPNGFKK